ncbi:MAG: hypothetical protein ACFB6S_11070 [Geminicoccaceae bacterium]
MSIVVLASINSWYFLNHYGVTLDFIVICACIAAGVVLLSLETNLRPDTRNWYVVMIIAGASALHAALVIFSALDPVGFSLQQALGLGALALIVGYVAATAIIRWRRAQLRRVNTDSVFRDQLRCDVEMARARRQKTSLSILAVQPDDGGTWGRPLGRLRRLFEEHIRMVDFVALVDLPAGVVVLVCPDTDMAGARAAATRLRRKLAEAGLPAVSIKPATFPDQGFSYDGLLQHAFAQQEQGEASERGRHMDKPDIVLEKAS